MTNRFLTAAGWLGTVLVALAVGRFAAFDPRWDAYLVWAASAGAACILIYAVASRRDRARRSTAPAERSRLPMATLASAVAVVVVLNILAGSYSRRWDLTPNHVYQLSPETRAALRRLDAPVRVLLFAQQADLPAHRDRLKEYSEASRLVAIEYVDVDAQPTVQVEADLQVGPRVQENGTAVVEYKGRVELIKAASEQDFTNALIRLREGRTRTLYFTAGHAERDTASTERVGYSRIAAGLQHENFLVQTINLAREGDVPADATLVIVAGPRADFFRAEIDALQRYLEKGGAVLFMVDPFEDLKRYITETGIALFMMDPSSASKTGELRNLTAFVREQGADLGNDVVVDNSQMGQFIGTDASVPVAVRYPPHPITQGLTSLSAYPMARSVRPVPGDGKTVSSIIETSDKSWSETDIQQLAAGRLSMDPGKGDRPGPVSLGVAVSTQPASQSRETRLVVVGDSDFVANYSANVPGNSEMFLSIIHWLAQEKVVTIPPRLPQERVLTMTASQRRNVFWFAVLLLPGLAVAAAYVWGRSGDFYHRGHEDGVNHEGHEAREEKQNTK